MNMYITTICVLSSFLVLSSSGYAENYKERFISEKAPVIAFTNARLIDGTGAVAKENQTVVIRDGRITKIGKDGQVNIPKDAKQISLKGKSLLPGWIMVHEHLYSSARAPEFEKISPYRGNRSNIFTQQSISFPRLYLAAGVTTARTMGSISPYEDLNIKKQIDAGVWVGPDFDLTAPHLDGEPAELQMNALKDAEDARDFVRYWAGEGFTGFHAYEDITYDQLQAAIDEASALGLPVAFHTTKTAQRQFTENTVSTWTALELGVDQVVHGLGELMWDLVVDEELERIGAPVDKYAKKDFIALVSDVELLSPDDPRVVEKVQASFQYLIDRHVVIESILNVNFRTPLPEAIQALYDDSGLKDYRAFRDSFVIDPDVNIDKLEGFARRVVEMEYAFWKAGGLLVLGSEAGQGLMAGYTNLRSIELLTVAGIPPLAAIQIATQNGAKAMKINGDRGTIEVGKRADLIVINGDPSRDINAIYNIETVFKNGIGYNPDALNESAKGAVRGPG